MVTIIKGKDSDIENIYKNNVLMGSIKKLNNGYSATSNNKGSHFQPDRDSAILWVLTLGQTTKPIESHNFIHKNN